MKYNGKPKTYKKDCEYTYTMGSFVTIELLKNQISKVEEVFVHSKYSAATRLLELCKDAVPVTFNDKIFDRIGVNQNNFTMGIFQKYTMKIDSNRPHIVLVNPSDMGNVGTIIRTALAMGYRDIAIISPAADLWHPKTIRASMGALFKVNVQYFESFEEYSSHFKSHQFFTFMLGAEHLLSYESCPQLPLFSLIYGNEGDGLDNSFLSVGTAIQIPQTNEVDSLNLAVATSIGAFTFAIKNGLLQA